MADVGQPYTSGRWLVREGRVDEFIRRWTAFTEWSRDAVAGAQHFALIQDSNEPRRFLSFGAWDASESVQAWRGSPEFAQQLGACRELCDEFEAHDFALVSEVTR
jgi:heme-degrading monooxygenase HmoA